MQELDRSGLAWLKPVGYSFSQEGTVALLGAAGPGSTTFSLECQLTGGVIGFAHDNRLFAVPVGG